MGKPQASSLRLAGNGQRTMAKIFDHVLELKTHLHPNGSSTSKEAWIELYNLCFNGDN
jgi:hypothetical protein